MTVVRDWPGLSLTLDCSSLLWCGIARCMVAMTGADGADGTDGSEQFEGADAPEAATLPSS